MNKEKTFEDFERHFSQIASDHRNILKEWINYYSCLWDDKKNQYAASLLINNVAEEIRFLKRSLKNECEFTPE